MTDLKQIRKLFDSNVDLFYNNKQIIFVDWGSYELYNKLTVRVRDDKNYNYIENLEDIKNE